MSSQRRTCSPFPSVACCGLLVVLGVGSGGCKVAGPPLPTLVDVVQSGSITPDNIKSIRIYKGDGSTWAFTKAEYARLPSRDVTSPAAASLLHEVRRAKTTTGHVWRNHPVSVYQGYMGVTLRDGTEYYVVYSLLSVPGELSFAFDALLQGETNPNRKKEYDSQALVGFMKQYDPWFTDRPTR